MPQNNNKAKIKISHASSSWHIIGFLLFDTRVNKRTSKNLMARQSEVVTRSY